MNSTTSTTSTLYSKYQHGSLPIDLGDLGHFNVTNSDGRQITYTSKRSLIASFYEGNDPHIPFDRYFRLGRYAEPVSTPVLDILEMFMVEPTARISISGQELGIDLRVRGHEVARLFYSGFAGRVHKEGLEPEDVLQEVYKGILSRNKGTCPFDPRKASFSHYVYMVTNCVLSNYRRQIHKCWGWEITGLDGNQVVAPEGEVEEVIPAAALADLEGWLQKQRRRRYPEIDLAIQMLPYLYAGNHLKEIAVLLEVPMFHINKAMTYLRNHARSWFDN